MSELPSSPENNYPTLKEYLISNFPKTAARLYLKKDALHTLSYYDLQHPHLYVKETWKPPAFEPYKDFKSLQHAIRSSFDQYYNTGTNTWNFGDSKGHELVAAYLLERGQIVGIENATDIDANILEALTDVLNMLDSREDLPDPYI